MQADFNNTRVLARAILEKSAAYEWSLQGMGLLRLHLSENTQLHVWDSRYRVKGVSMIHDHLQWGLASTIVAGRLKNHTYAVNDQAGSLLGEPMMVGLIKPGYGTFFKEEPREIRLLKGPAPVYEAGDWYSHTPAEIHETDALDGTVTIMRKTPTTDDSARVFWPCGEKWGSAEPRRATPDEVAEITAYALLTWFDQS